MSGDATLAKRFQPAAWGAIMPEELPTVPERASSAVTAGGEQHCQLLGEVGTQALARWMAPLLVPGDQLLLQGPLGAGKTSLVRALVAALSGEVELVASPTFTLLHEYDGLPPVVHVDAYRLADSNDLAAIGYDDLRQDAVACVEWPERVADHFDRSACWTLALDHRDPTSRLARLVAPVDRSPPALPAVFPSESDTP